MAQTRQHDDLLDVHIKESSISSWKTSSGRHVREREGLADVARGPSEGAAGLRLGADVDRGMGEEGLLTLVGIC